MPGVGTLRYEASAVDPTIHDDRLDNVLASGVVAVDARSNSDVGGYEILVAGGKEGHNYNVAYAKSEVDHDFDITAKDGLTFSTGTQADADMIGETKNWREHDGVLAGSYDVDLADELTKDASRVFGERNYALDYSVSGLISGDSFAELTEDGNGGRVDAFEWLHTANDALEVEAAANHKNKDGKGQIGDEIDKETGTVHYDGTSAFREVSEDINDDRYGITDLVTARNYSGIDTSSDGTQDIYQRPVNIETPSVELVINAESYTADELIEAIGGLGVFGNLADKLNHTYKDLLLTVSEIESANGTLVNAENGVYDLPEDADYETWTALEENPDWTALESQWAAEHAQQ